MEHQSWRVKNSRQDPNQNPESFDQKKKIRARDGSRIDIDI
jgi:hypothetical protein